MFILGINGSPRIKGNTDMLLDRALQGAKGQGARVEKIILNALKFVPCQECAKINKNGTCRVNDDWQWVYKKIVRADIIILASPIFFGSLSAQTKMFIDRFQCLWQAKYVFKKTVFKNKKIGVFIAVEASQRDDFLKNAKAIVKNFFATINAKYSGELLCMGVDKKGAILKHAEYLKKAIELGKTIADGGK